MIGYMLVTGKELLDRANEEGYAVGAFNINNMEFLKAIVSAAEEMNAPIIIATSESAIKYAGIEQLSAMVHAAARKSKIPIALHLDHGKHFETIINCIRHGYTSVMIDASKKPFEENVAITKKVVEVAHAVGISVEAELGRIAGVEDIVKVSAREALFTDPDEAKKFVELTGIDSLAVAIGTAHGPYKAIVGDKVELDFDRLKKIKELLQMPLVLHGASGVPQDLIKRAIAAGAEFKNPVGVDDESIKKAISLGINKVNIDTDLRIAFLVGVREFLKDHPDVYDPRKILKAGMEEISKVVKHKIKLFGAEGKAW